jgi:biopolymer transport protein ExbB
MTSLGEDFLEMMRSGGPMMWVLLALSILSLTVLFERFWFWTRTNSSRRLDRLSRMARQLREGDHAGAKLLAEDDGSVYGQVVLRLLEGKPNDAAAMDAVESQRPALERFMPFLTTIITGAPMIGLIGTVIGLIAAFRGLSAATAGTDPRHVSSNLAQALLNTVAGLVVAVIVLFPYNYFRAQIDRTLGRFETLIAAAQAGVSPDSRRDAGPSAAAGPRTTAHSGAPAADASRTA